LIEGNTVTNIATTSGIGQCIDLDGAGTVEWRHVVINNKVKNCSYVGIQLENVFDSRIENNIIEDSKSAGIIVISYDAGVKCKVGGETNQYGDTNGDSSCKGDQTNDIIRGNIISNKSGGWGWGYGGVIIWGAGGVKIYSNTFYASSNDGNGAINVQDPASVTSGTVAKNNIIFPGTGAAICAQDYASFSDDSYNLVYKTGDSNVYGIGSGCTKSYSLATYKSTFGKGQNSIQANPAFAAATSGDFHLQSTSPAIDQGTNVGSLTDIEGKSRPEGAGYDMGAYEFSGTPSCTLVNGTWTYGTWGVCSVTCGGGTQTRTATCTGATCGGTCTAVAVTTQSCNTLICPTSSPTPPPAPCTPVNGTWSYGTWGTCSVTCGGGTQTRTATCLGASCEGTCVGSALTSQSCNTQTCEVPPVNTQKPGDANGDDKIDETDYSIWLSNYQTSTTLKQKAGDFNGDGKVDGGDYIIWVTNFGK